jgi:hypothetical protein
MFTMPSSKTVPTRERLLGYCLAFVFAMFVRPPSHQVLVGLRD